MKREKLKKYITGYILGGSFFLFVIPGIIFYASFFSCLLLPDIIFRDNYLKAAITLIFLIPGIVFMIWSNTELILTGKGGPAEGFGIEISPKTECLVQTGPYRYTRNPMVFGAYSMYIAVAVFINSYTSLILVLLFLPLIILYLKKSEEKRLFSDFGEDYRLYREKVSILIPLPPKK